MNKKTTIIAIIAAVLVLILAGVGVALSSRSEKVPENPSGTIGNLGGNLNNGGYFVEHDGIVYFANSYDADTLYKMNVDESGIEKMSTTVVQNLLAGGNYLYYFQLGSSGATGLGGVRVPHAFNRCRLDGSRAKNLTRETVVTGQLVGSHLFLLIQGETGSYLTRLKIDESEETQVAAFVLNPAGAVGNQIYYNGTAEDHNLYVMDAGSCVQNLVIAGNVYNPVVDGEYIYYQNLADDYSIYRVSIYGGDPQKVTPQGQRVEFFNVAYGYLYYTVMGNNPQLWRCYSDGSEPIALATGVFNSINITPRFVYFRDYNDDSITYHSPLGSTNYSTFDGAMAAALQNLTTEK